MDTKAIFDEIEQKTQEKHYIFRGESQKYNECSSTLYRTYKREIKEHADNSDESTKIEKIEEIREEKRTKIEKIKKIEEIENKIISDVKDRELEPELDDLNLWSKLQHYGGDTNLIDFTKSYHIALFFACEKDTQKDGRIILQETNSEIKKQIREPKIPQNRIIAQKSIFIRPPTGVLPIEESVTIPSHLKPDLKKYLKDNFDISEKTIYNDLHGYITQYRNKTKQTRGQFLHFQYLNKPRVSRRVFLSPESWKKIKELSKKCINKHYVNPKDYFTWMAEIYIYLCENLEGFEQSILPVGTNVDNDNAESNGKLILVLKKGQKADNDPEGDPVYIKEVGISKK